MRGLYTQAALLAHDCIGNTLITVDNDKLLKVYASIDIKAGDIIYNNYTASLYVSLCQVNLHRFTLKCPAFSNRSID